VPGPEKGIAARRVLYFNAWSSAHGGSSTSLIDIVSRLDPERFEPLVLCSDTGDLTRRLEEIGVPFVVRQSSRFSREEIWQFLPQVPGFARWLRRERIALVHGNTGASRRSLVVACRLAGVPYLQHVRNPVKNARRSFAFRLASRIVANSQHTASSLVADPLFARKTVTIYNAVDLARYDAVDDRRDELAAAGRPVIGFVGHLVPNKGTLTVIEAMPRVVAACPDALLVIVGCAPDGEESYEQQCRQRVAELGLGPHVVFTGYRRDVPALMRSFDVFVLPTRTETFGKVVIEAMAAARPVVVSNVGGIPEIVSRSDLGTLIPPDDPGAAAEGIVRYLSDRALAARVGEAGRLHVRAHFSLDRMGERLQDLYDLVLHEKASGSRRGAGG
jgi:glycosyltransferase involved in cell wall biosynthesis